MADIAAQSALAGAWDEHPIDTNLTHVGLAMHAAADAVLAVSSMILADHTPLYAYQPVARFGIECCAIAHYLTEADIGAKERVRRSLNNRLISDYERQRLPEEVRSESDARSRILEAVSLGFVKSSAKARIPYLGAQPPKISKLVRDVLRNDRLGTVLYSHLSAVSHGTIWGLVAVAKPQGDIQSRPAAISARLVNSSQRIAMSSLGLLLAYLEANDRVLSYIGWSDEAWTSSSQQARLLGRQYLPPADNGRSLPD